MIRFIIGFTIIVFYSIARDVYIATKYLDFWCSFLSIMTSIIGILLLCILSHCVHYETLGEHEKRIKRIEKRVNMKGGG